jgi:hypothetical protein
MTKMRGFFCLVALSIIYPTWAHTPFVDLCLVNNDMLQIANIQGRYLHLLNSDALNLVPELFASNSNVTLLLPDNPTGIPLKGLANITAEFLDLKNKTTVSGGFMGTHLATTPVIKVSDDRSTAQGSWMSVGFTVLGPGFGNTNPPYKTLPVVGRYAHDFVNENGVWKIQHFTWTIFVSLPSFDFNPATAGPGWANTPMAEGTKATSWPLDPYDTL